MMKTKRIVLLTVICALVAIIAIVGSAFAAWYINTDNAKAGFGVGDWDNDADKRLVYELNDEEDGYIVTGYEGAYTRVKVPAVHEGESGTLPVVGIAIAEDDSIVELVLPSSVKEIAAGSFIGSDKLVKITFGEGLESIGENAFVNCDSIKEIVLPSTVTAIGAGAFGMCSALSRIEIKALQESVVLGENAFIGVKAEEIIWGAKL